MLQASPMGKLFVTGAAHVYQPFQFPKLYPNEMAWMKFIKPTNCKYELEFRDVYFFFKLRMSTLIHQKRYGNRFKII